MASTTTVTTVRRRKLTPSGAAVRRTMATFFSDGSALRRSKPWGDFAPVGVALGLIMMSVALGLHTARQQLVYSPSVFVDKRKRETVPEMAAPDWTVEEAEKFLSNSLFRRIAQRQDFDAIRAGIADPTRDPGNRVPAKAETLKDVGVEPPGIPTSGGDGIRGLLTKLFSGNSN